MTADLTAHLLLHLGDQTPKVAVRAVITRCPGDRYQPFRFAAPARLTELIQHDLADRVGVLRNECTLGAFVTQRPGLMGEHFSFHRLGVDPDTSAAPLYDPRRVHASTSSMFLLADNNVDQPLGCVIGN